VRWIRRFSVGLGFPGHAVRRWLAGWRGLVLSLALAGLLSALALMLRQQPGAYFDFGYQVAARLAGAACLTVMLVAINVVVDWLHRQSVRLQRHLDQALLAVSRELPTAQHRSQAAKLAA
jgi:hypothetical protein